MAHSPEKIEARAELFRVLGHPVRLNVLCALAQGEISVGDLAERTQLGMSLLSQQLGILRRAEFVTTRREGKQVFYAVHLARVRDLRNALDALLKLDSAEAPAGAPPELGQARLTAAMFARIQPKVRD